MKWPILIFMVVGLLVSAAYAQSLFEYDRVDFFKSVDIQGKTNQTVRSYYPETAAKRVGRMLTERGIRECIIVHHVAQ